MNYGKTGLYVEEAELDGYAENLARRAFPDGTGSGRGAARRLRRALRELRRLTAALSARWGDAADTPGWARWMLDNAYLVRREGESAARALAAARRLRLRGSEPVVCCLAAGLLASGHGELSPARTAHFLAGAQRVLPLGFSELGALPDALRAAAVIALPRRAEAGDEDGCARLITVLRTLADGALDETLWDADLVERLLRRDPAGVYPRMDEQSRALYRQCLAECAAAAQLPETRAAEKALALARTGTGVQRHVGWWLFVSPLGAPEKPRRGGWYLAANVLLTLFFALLAGFASRSAAAAALLVLPLSELCKRLLDFALLRLLPPVSLPRLSLSGGVPPEGKTLCTVTSLVGDEEAAARLAEHALLCRGAGENLAFALLLDYPASAAPPTDDQRAAASRAAAEITALNAKYGGGFFCLLREPVKTPEGAYVGWERKRGALLELMRLLRGQPGGVTVTAGDAAALADTRFLLTLDADTRLTPGAAQKLIGALLHPLNRPVWNADGVVTRGFGVLAPRLAPELASANASDFARVFAGRGGTDPYCGACSDLGMALFGRGGFAGKGLVDIDAYLACLGARIPENRCLSHDAVEGAFLRAGFVGEAELTDAFPAAVPAYFRRLERWTRGDWQNLPYLLRAGRALPEAARWQLFDSLRRSLVPAAELAALALGFFLPGPGLRLAAIAAGLAFGGELLLAAAEAILNGGTTVFLTRAFFGFGGGLVRTWLRLLLLPAEGWCCLTAALRALWRMGVSKKRLLQWQTAAQCAAARQGLWGFYRALWPAAALGLALMLWSPLVLGKAAGVLWLLTPVFAFLLSLPAAPPPELSPRDRDYLLGCARDTWGYFARVLTAEDHFLPPDNLQVQPPVGIAHRTSPTNIGLGALSVLAAADLGFVSAADAAALLGRMLDTAERLEKWRGHLYNWYDTRTLAPLEPRYVSTVDSGNLCASLLALRAGLTELHRPDLAARAEALADAMDFAPLFDRKRKLFHTGFDVTGGALSRSWYDLLASEARLTGYLAAARGDVPAEHWTRLSRAQSACGPYRGLVSWTGTMFEYLMPELLLPPQRGSLLWESAKFCLYVQRRRGREAGTPWGVSESAYAALSPDLSYRYKAHGCAALALHRGMDRENVVSPYSAFLALAVSPAAAVRDLRRLESLGMRGELGFWEALDYSTSRLYRTAPAAVRAVFAHHAGMSLAALDNALCAGAMQRRFFADPTMRAYAGLLAEALPVGSRPMRRSDAGEEPVRRAARSDAAGWETSGEGVDALTPRCTLLASRSYSLLAAETGLTRPLWRGVTPYLSPASPMAREKGVDVLISADGEAWSALPDPAERDVRYAWRFTPTRAEFTARRGAIESRCTVCAAENEIGERRDFLLRNDGDRPADAALTLHLRPLLAAQRDYDAHPAFLSLGVSARVRDGALLLRRLPRGGTRELWMCVALSAPARFDLAPGAWTGRAAEPVWAGAEERFLTDPAVTVTLALPLLPGTLRRAAAAIAMAWSATDALDSARRILHGAEPGALPQTAAALLGFDGVAAERAFSLLPLLAFPTAGGAAGAAALWRFGISGDLPVLWAEIKREDELAAAQRLMDLHLFLTGCGQDFDLVLLTRDAPGYHRPLRSAMDRALRRAGGELLQDARGGVHLLSDPGAAAALEGFGALRLDLSAPLPEPPRQTHWRPAEPPVWAHPPQRVPKFEWCGAEFVFYVNRSLPPRTWANVLTNGRLGYLTADCGTGNIWWRNARERQLTPWLCQPNGTEGPESLALELGGLCTSLFAAPGDTACRVRFAPGAAVWEKRIGEAEVRVTAFIPPKADVRLLLIESDRPLPGAAVCWCARLRLGGDAAAERSVQTAFTGLALAAKNLAVMPEAGPLYALSAEPPEGFTCRGSSAMARDYDGFTGRDAAPVFAARWRFRTAAVLALGFGRPENLRALCEPEAARRALAETREYWRRRCGALTLRSGEAALDRLMNGWLPYQTLACRLLGRCSIYQSGGAFGFRDQLQDAVNLIGLDPALAREQILRSCARQYLEGDVQHWWHTDAGAVRGVRTRCSDDLLWLVWAVCEYVEKTGDDALLAEHTPCLRSPELAPGERDRYETAEATEETFSVAEHCRRAIERVMTRGCGAHGLLCIGGGDWNDGFDAVGGESEWLSFFFLLIAPRWAAIAEPLGLDCAELAAFCDTLREASNAAWDGAWFRRGYYASGAPLGAAENAECRIDSVAQSFAALSGAADPERTKTALRSAAEQLFDRKNALVRLFAPPFAGAEKPGYLVSYGPGFRENGGQYTHGALWLVLALLRTGETETAWTLLRAMLPAERDTAVYKTEPFVLAADVSAAQGHEGEGGWSWYTGASGWLWRIVSEEILGLRWHGGLVYVEPRLPAALNGCRFRYLGREFQLRDGAVYVDGALYRGEGLAFPGGQAYNRGAGKPTKGDNNI